MVWRGEWWRALTRRESNRDRYGYTHPSPTVDLHMGKGCQIPGRFSSPPPNGELVLASTVYGRGQTQISLSLSPSHEQARKNSENAKMSEIIIYGGVREGKSEIPT